MERTSWERRALGVSEVKFTGQILPTSAKVTYEIDMKRVIARSLVMGLGDGIVRVDGRAIYHATDLKVGLFMSTDVLIKRTTLKESECVE